MKKAFASLWAKKRGKKGFTLVELVIVIAVLAIIAGIAIPTVHNVINNANKTADDANAQAIELAIKTCQSEVAAESTTHSAAAAVVIADPDSKLTTLLTQYGVDPTTLSQIKQGSTYHFLYDGPSGKVTVVTGTAGTNQTILSSNTTYTVANNMLTIDTST